MRTVPSADEDRSVWAAQNDKSVMVFRWPLKSPKKSPVSGEYNLRAWVEREAARRVLSSLERGKGGRKGGERQVSHINMHSRMFLFSFV